MKVLLRITKFMEGKINNMEKNTKLISKIIITGEIHVMTGLMIGGSSTGLDINSIDKAIIRNPIDQLPFIPGSTLKGKMRSLLELKRNTTEGFGEPTQNPEHEAAILFGHIQSKNEAAKKAQKELGRTQQPSRLIVRDGDLLNPENFINTDRPYSELKVENSINRITAKANPRTFERVPRGGIFKLNMTLNVFDEKEGEAQLALIYECLRLVKDDYLGGGGSRGNGMVNFKIKEVEVRSDKFYKGEEKGKSMIDDVPDDLICDKLLLKKTKGV